MEIRRCDLLIIGSGCAGVAAVGGAIPGVKRIVLVEKEPFPVSLICSSGIETVCGAFYNYDSERPRPACGPFVSRFFGKLADSCGTQPFFTVDNLWVLPFDPSVFRGLADRFLKENGRVSCLFNSNIKRLFLNNSNRRIRHVMYSNTMGDYLIEPKWVIDCSGMALVSQLAGIQYRAFSSRQPLSVLFSFTPVTTGLSESFFRISVLRKIFVAVLNGILPKYCQNITFLPMTRPDTVTLRLTLPIAQYSAQSCFLEDSFSQKIEHLAGFLLSNHDAFKNAALTRLSTKPGCRLIGSGLGINTLMENDILHGKNFSDRIAFGTWPIEEWQPDGKCRLTHLKAGGCYGISMGCLMSKSIDNLLFAGRCISAEFSALASARVIGTSMATGWAAGRFVAALNNGMKVTEVARNIMNEYMTGHA